MPLLTDPGMMLLPAFPSEILPPTIILDSQLGRNLSVPSPCLPRSTLVAVTDQAFSAEYQGKSHDGTSKYKQVVSVLTDVARKSIPRASGATLDLPVLMEIKPAIGTP